MENGLPKKVSAWSALKQPRFGRGGSGPTSKCDRFWLFF